ncbi:hypothetical protein B0J14DRAFT_659983 [Halenospora varia]|nr:hypothetical protein B0J14DRAFT_659983 [Halenospora varia]
MEEELSVLDTHLLMSLVNSNTPVFDTLMSMLRPMDIVSLALATSFRVRPPRGQIQFYMKWWKQVFYDMRWVEHNGSKITIIGRDLARLKNSLKTWTYDSQATFLLVVVQETLLTEGTRDDRRQGLVQSIDTDIPYAWTSTEHQVRAFEEPIQMCVFFLENNLFIDLDWTWLYKLLEQIEPPAKWHSPWYLPDIINPLPAGLFRSVVGFDMCMKTWYVNLNLPGFIIDTAITRSDLQIEAIGPAWHEVDGSAIRIAVTEDCSIVIPEMFRRHNLDPSF